MRIEAGRINVEEEIWSRPVALSCCHFGVLAALPHERLRPKYLTLEQAELRR